MHEELVRLGGLSLPRNCDVRLTEHPDTTLDVYCGRKTTTQHSDNKNFNSNFELSSKRVLAKIEIRKKMGGSGGRVKRG